MRDQILNNSYQIFAALCMLALVANRMMDTLKDKFWLAPKWMQDRPGFWNPEISWANKHKERGNSKIANLIERLDNAQLTMFTDGWHLFKEIMLSSISAACAVILWKLFPYSGSLPFNYFVTRILFYVGFILLTMKIRIILIAFFLIITGLYWSWGFDISILWVYILFVLILAGFWVKLTVGGK